MEKVNTLEISRYAIAASLLYATVITLQCPCDPLLGCHLPHFYLSTLAPVALVVMLNRNNVPPQ
jgi:hypothetical protein